MAVANQAAIVVNGMAFKHIMAAVVVDERLFLENDGRSKAVLIFLKENILVNVMVRIEVTPICRHEISFLSTAEPKAFNVLLVSSTGLAVGARCWGNIFTSISRLDLATRCHIFRKMGHI